MTSPLQGAPHMTLADKTVLATGANRGSAARSAQAMSAAP
jgi:hypothetical protein